MSGVVAENKVRKFKILPFGHRREHLAAYVPNIKEQASLRTGFFSLFSSLSLSFSLREFYPLGGLRKLCGIIDASRAAFFACPN